MTLFKIFYSFSLAVERAQIVVSISDFVHLDHRRALAHVPNQFTNLRLFSTKVQFLAKHSFMSVMTSDNLVQTQCLKFTKMSNFTNFTAKKKSVFSYLNFRAKISSQSLIFVAKTQTFFTIRRNIVHF